MIKKWKINKSKTLTFDKVTRPMSVIEQNGNLILYTSDSDEWAGVYKGTEIKVMLVGTGKEAPKPNESEVFSFLQTVAMKNGEVWHVFTSTYDIGETG